MRPPEYTLEEARNNAAEQKRQAKLYFYATLPLLAIGLPLLVYSVKCDFGKDTFFKVLDTAKDNKVIGYLNADFADVNTTFVENVNTSLKASTGYMLSALASGITVDMQQTNFVGSLDPTSFCNNKNFYTDLVGEPLRALTKAMANAGAYGFRSGNPAIPVVLGLILTACGATTAVCSAWTAATSSMWARKANQMDPHRVGLLTEQEQASAVHDAGNGVTDASGDIEMQVRNS
ncbi:MAG: hypothetical protein P1U40_05345 [Coxiellaceae bacterium]|nr:hypothetical protein [Coxiellaceae bacterium]